MSAHITHPTGFDEGSGLEKRVRSAMAAGRIGTWECKIQTGGTGRPARGRKESLGGFKGKPARAERLSSEPGTDFRSGQVFLSTELLAILGMEEGEFDGTLESWLGKVSAPDRSTVLKAFKKAVRHDTGLEVEIPLSQGGRAPVWLLVRGQLYHDAEGRPERLAGVAVDITAQKAAELKALQEHSEAERQLAARTKQLRAATEELEAFCYSISHDLRAPLRSIRGFNEVLLERYAARLDPRAQEFLRRACESGQSMDRLIEDLLKFSRVGRAELTRRPVDLTKLALGIAESLRASAPERRVNFQIAPSVRASGDERLLRVVLENLLANAWKFSCKQADAHIQFGFASAPTEAFFVRDDGAGFDPAYAGRLFGVFQKLHSEKEFAGTGVGLAMVQRIVNRHGGRVWAEGRRGGGATFYFSLPNDELI
jgi:signal transduction histidine kinase